MGSFGSQSISPTSLTSEAGSGGGMVLRLPDDPPPGPDSPEKEVEVPGGAGSTPFIGATSIASSLRILSAFVSTRTPLFSHVEWSPTETADPRSLLLSPPPSPIASRTIASPKQYRRKTIRIDLCRKRYPSSHSHTQNLTHARNSSLDGFPNASVVAFPKPTQTITIARPLTLSYFLTSLQFPDRTTPGARIFLRHAPSYHRDPTCPYLPYGSFRIAKALVMPARHPLSTSKTKEIVMPLLKRPFRSKSSSSSLPCPDPHQMDRHRLQRLSRQRQLTI